MRCFLWVWVMIFGGAQSALANNFAGYLLFTFNDGVQNTIKELELTTLKTKTILRADKPHVTFESLTKIDEENFLFSERSYIDERRISLIKKFNRKTQQTNVVVDGFYPTYIPEHRSLFFFRSSTQTGPRLFLLREDGNEIKQIGSDLGKFSGLSPVIQISHDEVVFLVRDATEAPIYIYNLATGELREQRLKEFCRPKVWLKTSGKLMCSDSRGNYYLTNLRENTEEKSFLGGVGLPILYIEDSDSMVYLASRFSFGETHDLWVHSFLTKKNMKLLENVSVRSGGAIWFK